jgi:hypothetical protein
VPDSFGAETRASSLVFLLYAPRLVFDIPRTLGLVYMFCAPVLIFGGTDCAVSRLYVLHSRTHFLRRQVQFSCFALTNSFSTIPRASGPVFIFCAPKLIFGGIEGVRFIFMFYAPGLALVGTEGVGSSFHVLGSRTHFRLYRGCRVLFPCFALPDPFWVVSRLSGPIFMFCAPGLIFNGTEDVRSRLLILRSQTRF